MATTVTRDIQTQASSYASDALRDAAAFMSAAKEIVTTINTAATTLETALAWDNPPYTYYNPGEIAPYINDASLDTYFTTPSAAALTNLGTTDISSAGVDGVTLNEFTTVAPVLSLAGVTFPTAVASFTDSPTAFVMPDRPAVPADVVIDDFDLGSDIVASAMDTLTIPQLDVVFPELQFDEEIAKFMYIESQPTPAAPLSGAMMADVQPYSVDEQRAMWEEAQILITRATDKVVAEAENRTAARGFSAPPGAMLYMIDSALRDAAEKHATATAQITIQNAKERIDWRKARLSSATQIDIAIMNEWGRISERQLKASMAAVEMGVATYNAKATQIRALVDIYKAKTDSYQVELKAALVPLEVYKAQNEGKQVEVSMKQSKVAAYRAYIEGVVAKMSVYKTRADIFTAEVNAERVKLEEFRGKVEAYSATVQAKSAEYQAYKSRIDAEIAKANLYEAEVKGYRAFADGKIAKLEVEKSKIAAAIQKNDGALKIFEGKLVKYKADIDAEKIKTESNILLRGQNVDIWSKTGESRLRQQEMTARMVVSNNTQAIEVAKGKVQAAEASSKVLLSYLTTTLEFNSQASAMYRKAVEGYLSQVVGIAAQLEAL